MNHEARTPDPSPRTTGDAELDRALARLPEERSPERDLWPELESRLGDRRPSSGPVPLRAAGGAFGTLAGLAMAAGVAAALLGLGWVFRPPGPAGPAAAGPAAASASHYEVPGTGALDRSLMAALERRRQQLGPETASSVEADILQLGSAVTDLLRALANKPDDPALHRHLAARQHQQAELLTRLSRL